MQYWIDKKFIYFKFGYNKDVIEFIKEIPNKVFNPNLKTWYAPMIDVTNYHFKELHKMGFERLSQAPNLVSNDFAPNQKEVDDFFAKMTPYHLDIDKLNLNFKPRTYQNPAIDLCLNEKTVIIADDMGLGKTLEAIFSAEIGKLFPCLVICPSCVKYNWAEKWTEANPDRIIQVIETKKPLIDADVYVINYDILAKKETVLDKYGEEVKKVVFRIPELKKINFECIVLDEAHFLKNAKSDRTKVTSLLAKKSEYVFALTGTPIENRPSEYISLLSIIKRFKPLFSDWENFVTRYCDAKKGTFWDISGASNQLELNHKLRTSCYIRREKSEVMKDLPPSQKTIINVKLSNIKTYNKAKENIIQYLTENDGESAAFMAMNAQYLVMRSRLEKLSIEGKEKEIINYIDSFLENSNKKLVIAGIHRDILINLSAKYKALLINGDKSSEEKQRIVKKFQVGTDRLLFGNIQSMGTGTDGLQNVCSDMLIIELPKKPTVLEQLYSRIDRSGQKFPTNFILLLSNESIDKDLWDSNEMKRYVVDAANKGIEVDKMDFDKMFIKNLKQSKV